MRANEIIEYQMIKKRFLGISFAELKILIRNMSIDAQIGLKREYRAYKYLQAKYSSYDVVISSVEDDTKRGIDLVATKGDITRIFQVTGSSELSDNSYIGEAEYLLIVSDNKIYQKKVHLTPQTNT